MRHEIEYHVVETLHHDNGYTIAETCRALHVAPSAYYKWKNRVPSAHQRENERILARLRLLYDEFEGTYGCARLHAEYNARYHTRHGIRRIHRLLKIAGLKAVIRWNAPPELLIKRKPKPPNLVGHHFQAASTNEKWLTDVTEMAYGRKKKLYLSAILDLASGDIVAFAISPHNNNRLVHTTLDRAIAKYPNARPIIHSDCGFQYTSLEFRRKLAAHGMTQSMSRPGHCDDNAPMEAFWGTLKSEMYHLYQFDDFDTLAYKIAEYIWFYNNRRRQSRLGGMPPLVYRRLTETPQPSLKPLLTPLEPSRD